MSLRRQTPGSRFSSPPSEFGAAEETCERCATLWTDISWYVLLILWSFELLTWIWYCCVFLCYKWQLDCIERKPRTPVLYKLGSMTYHFFLSYVWKLSLWIFNLLSIYTYYILVQEKISLLDIRFCCLNSLHITFADTTVGFWTRFRRHNPGRGAG